ncbi:hypothetical protein FCV25MIE_16331 [Fagus crenata]
MRPARVMSLLKRQWRVHLHACMRCYVGQSISASVNAWWHVEALIEEIPPGFSRFGDEEAKCGARFSIRSLEWRRSHGFESSCFRSESVAINYFKTFVENKDLGRPFMAHKTSCSRFPTRASNHRAISAILCPSNGWVRKGR